MKLYELLEDAFAIINDKMRITIQISGVGVASGNWFQDQILAYDQHEVLGMNFDFLTNKLIVDVRGDLVI